MVNESNQTVCWEETEWGFPKGRRNYQENDYNCAVREFQEETGIDSSNIVILQNVSPYEETFTGSNYKSYKHKYLLSFIQNTSNINMNNFEKSEVSCMEWMSYDKCIKIIRHYNLEKLDIMKKIDHTITSLPIMKML